MAELVQAARSWAETPTVIAIVLAGLTALGLMAVVGLIVAVTPDNFVLGGGSGSGVFKEFVRDTIATTQARFGSSSFNYALLPILFAVVPILASAVGAYRNAARTAGLPVRRRLLVGAATGVPLALAVLILSGLGDGDGQSFGSRSILLYCLLWGGVGGLIGAARAVGPNAWDQALASVPPPVARWLRLTGTAARPLLTVLVIAGVIGVITWEVQSIRDQYSAVQYQSKTAAIVGNPFSVGDYAIDVVALGTLTKVRYAGEDGRGPLPVDNGRSVSTDSTDFRIFAFHSAYPAYVYVFLLILLIALPVAFAVYAGYATAIRAGAREAGPAIGYGALVGLVWALLMVILRAIGDEFTVVGDSLFVSVLLVTGAAGALGGLFASVRPPRSQVTGEAAT